MARLTQLEANARCEMARQRYRALTQLEARTRIAFEVQGFVASEVERGVSIAEACGKIAELLLLLGKGNELDFMQ